MAQSRPIHPAPRTASTATEVPSRRDPGDEYVAIMEGQLVRWGSRIDALETRARQASAEERPAYARRAETSRAMRKDISRRLQELRGASQDRVGSLRAGLALAWRQFTAQVGGPSEEASHAGP
jgi:hypothetical protein